MTSLERVREHLATYKREEMKAIIDAHEKEDAAREIDRKQLHQAWCDAETELAALREAVRVWNKASIVWLDAAQARPYDPVLAAQRAIERREAEDGLRQLVEEKL